MYKTVEMGMECRQCCNVRGSQKHVQKWKQGHDCTFTGGRLKKRG